VEHCVRFFEHRSVYYRAVAVPSTREPTQAVGINLRRWREQRSLSLSALARTSGIGKATLSDLERGRGNPSLETLWALARALRVPFAALFEDEVPGDEVRVVRYHDAPVIAASPAFVSRHMLSRDHAGRFEVYLLELAEGRARRARGHGTALTEHVFVASGRARVGPQGDAVAVLEEHDAISFRTAGAHRYEALDGPAHLLIIHEYPEEPTT
jgi:transcriptional regulator with XRE-family HTH domain